MSSFKLFMLLSVCAPTLLVAQFRSTSSVTQLPSTDECGILKPDQLYNLEKLAEPDEFPWMGKLRYGESEGETRLDCLSTLISRHYLISPAHCFDYSQPDAVLFGDCKDKCKLVTGISFIKHELYEKGKVEYDIGLVKLAKPIRYTYFMRPICLPTNNLMDEGYVAHHLMSTGNVRNVMESNKRFLLVVDLNHCRSFYYNHEVGESLLCASTCENGSRFISGSVLMGVNATRTRANHYYIIGLLTFGYRECVDNTPDIFQRIDVYVDWIKKTIQR